MPRTAYFLSYRSGILSTAYTINKLKAICITKVGCNETPHSLSHELILQTDGLQFVRLLMSFSPLVSPSTPSSPSLFPLHHGYYKIVMSVYVAYMFPRFPTLPLLLYLYISCVLLLTYLFLQIGIQDSIFMFSSVFSNKYIFNLLLWVLINTCECIYHAKEKKCVSIKQQHLAVRMTWNSSYRYKSEQAFWLQGVY